MDSVTMTTQDGQEGEKAKGIEMHSVLKILAEQASAS